MVLRPSTKLYRCVLSDLVFDWKRDCCWLCFDANLNAWSRYWKQGGLYQTKTPKPCFQLKIVILFPIKVFMKRHLLMSNLFGSKVHESGSQLIQKRIIFASTRRTETIETAKYAVFRANLRCKAVYDVPSITVERTQPGPPNIDQPITGHVYNKGVRPW